MTQLRNTLKFVAAGPVGLRGANTPAALLAFVRLAREKAREALKHRVYPGRNGWFVDWLSPEGHSGPWATKEAAEAAGRLDWDEAHRLHSEGRL